MTTKRKKRNRIRLSRQLKSLNAKLKTKATPRERFVPSSAPTISSLRKVIIGLQGELALAIRSGNKDLIEKLVRKIPRSLPAREWAVYRTISAVGSRTKGLNDLNRPTTRKQYSEMTQKLWEIVKSPHNYKASPLKRIWLPKPQGGLRPISVPSYIDRAIQHLYNLILSVVYEEMAEPNSFGFRPFRSPGWSQKAVTLAIWSRKGFGPPKVAIELDIAKCFDTISHDFILNNISSVFYKGISIPTIPQHILKQWCKSGYVDIKGQLSPKDQTIPTEMGVPQGGPISPTISNIVLHGIEDIVRRAVSKTPVTNPFMNFSPATKILGSKTNPTGDPIPFLCSSGFISRIEIVQELTSTGLLPSGSLSNKQILNNRHLEGHGLRFDSIDFEDPSTVSSGLINESWSRLLLFADDCLILVNSRDAANRALNAIKKFLEPRGLEINMSKTKIKDLHRETFDFFGFTFDTRISHGLNKVHSFPPPRKVQALREKVRTILRQNKGNPYNAFFHLNALLRG
jgi:retron-type reverse transcriptase